MKTIKAFIIFFTIFTFPEHCWSQEGLNEDNWKFFPPATPADTDLVKSGIFQNSDTILPDSLYNKPAYVEIIQDYRIKALLEKEVSLNGKKQTIDGYRIQVYFGSGSNSQKEANIVKSDFLSRYPDEFVTVDYVEPYFKTRIGNCRTRLEAEKQLKEIAVDFPESFIVPCEINLPELH